MKTKIVSAAVALALLAGQWAYAQSRFAFEANIANAFDVSGGDWPWATGLLQVACG